MIRQSLRTRDRAEASRRLTGLEAETETLPSLFKPPVERTTWDTAARNMIVAGVSERVTMAIMGHKTRAMLDRYHIVTPADLQEATRKLAQARHNESRVEL